MRPDIDKKNREILEILQEKARIPNVEVSRMINMAPSAVLERIRKMETQKIIDGYEVRLNPEHFNCRQISFSYVYPGHKADKALIGELLSGIDQIQEVHFVTGEDCYLIKARTADTVELDTLLRTKILSIDGVVSSRTHVVLSTQKETAQIPIKI